MQTPSDLQPAVVQPDPFRAGAQFDHMTQPRIARLVGIGPGIVIYDCNEFDDTAGRWVCIQKNFMRPVADFLRDYHPAPEGS